MQIIKDILWKLAVLRSNSTLLLSDYIDLVIVLNLSEPRFSHLNKTKLYTMRK